MTTLEQPRWPGRLVARGLALVLVFLRRLDRHDVLSHASSIAFSFLLSLVPLLVLIGYVLGHFARARGTQTLLGPFLETAPESVQVFLVRELDRLAGATSGAIAPVAAITFLWMASSGVHGLLTGLELALRSDRRKYWQKRLLAIGFVLLGLSALAVDTVVLTKVGLREDVDGEVVSAPHARTMDAARNRPTHRTGLAAVGEKVGERSAAVRRRLRVNSGVKYAAPLSVVAIVSVGLALIYRFGYRLRASKDGRKRTHLVWPGVSFAMVLWVLITLGFGFYARTLASYSVYYGSVAAFAVLGIWMWLTAACLVSGAELNVALAELRDGKVRASSGSDPKELGDPEQREAIQSQRMIAEAAVASEGANTGA
jgi:membrane protein